MSEAIKILDKMLNITNEILLEQANEEIKLYKKLSKINDKIEKIASEVCGFYGDEFSYDIDDYYGASGEMRFRCVLNRDMEERNDVYKYSGKLARQKQFELNELIKQKQALISELSKG
jgi:hypothetical protein